MTVTEPAISSTIWSKWEDKNTVPPFLVKSRNMSLNCLKATGSRPRVGSSYTSTSNFGSWRTDAMRAVFCLFPRYNCFSGVSRYFSISKWSISRSIFSSSAAKSLTPYKWAMKYKCSSKVRFSKIGYGQMSGNGFATNQVDVRKHSWNILAGTTNLSPWTNHGPAPWTGLIDQHFPWPSIPMASPIAVPTRHPYAWSKRGFIQFHLPSIVVAYESCMEALGQPLTLLLPGAI